MRFGAPQFFGQRERRGLCHDLPTGQFDIGMQALDVDLKSFGDFDNGCERA